LSIIPAIISSQDIGSLGIKEGTAKIYTWKWYYSMSVLGLWIVPALAILLFRENRYPRVLLIFIPIFLVRVFWSQFQYILGAPFGVNSEAPSEVLEVFRALIDALAIGLAVLWLLAYKLGNRNRIITLVLAMVVLAGVTVIAVVLYQVWIPFDLVIFQSLGIATMLVIFVLAGWRCRKRYGPWRFMLWLALWAMVISLVAIIAYFLILEGQLEELIGQIPKVLYVGFIFGLYIYILNLPFMILAFASPFFRRRFYAYFHLNSMPISSASGIEKSRSGDSEQK
jgi:hypothetical protein